MAKLVPPTIAIRLVRIARETGQEQISSVHHLPRAKDPTHTVCGQEVCERCRRVRVDKVKEGAQWCTRCLGAMKVTK
jgi:hypothetical protein